ncbi:MAG TPA: DUF6379 domain-containing protein, partial [Microbacterium sp.]|uniref:C-glycoside deglycosidase beta subunit domain-containing protein n=1 Tax=Microbacterium sp. TaxID=51671 RepID=UPI002F931F94
MTLPVLLDDALSTTAGGFSLRVSLPWIRSMPLASVANVAVAIDGEPVAVSAAVDGRTLTSAELAGAPDWWFIQDRLELRGERLLAPGTHDVSLSFTLLVPYLQAGPTGPLTLPFHAERPLVLGAPASGATAADEGRASSVGSDAVAGVRSRSEERPSATTLDAWTVSASAFNWTPEVIRAQRPADDIAVGIVAQGIAETIEIEAGQVWRSFPKPSDADVDRLGERLAAA